MANDSGHESWESAIIAAAVALAGTLFLFEKFRSLLQSDTLAMQALLYCTPIVLVLAGVSLVAAERWSLLYRKRAAEPNEKIAEVRHGR